MGPELTDPAPSHNILIVAEVRLCAIPQSGSARSGQWAA